MNGQKSPISSRLSVFSSTCTGGLVLLRAAVLVVVVVSIGHRARAVRGRAINLIDW